MSLLVTVQYADGTHKARSMDPEDAATAMRELTFRLASSVEVVCVTVSKADPITRLMDGKMKCGQ